MNFDTSSLRRQLSSPDIIKYPKVVIKEFRLTPIIEDLNDLKLASSEKKVKDDFNLNIGVENDVE